jgi:hypothetical protein
MKTMKLLFLFLLGALSMQAQESETLEDYYYYNGKKVPLILNEEKVVGTRWLDRLGRRAGLVFIMSCSGA